jgi:hypothetical protein
LDYDALQLKTFCQERQFYTMVVSSKLLIRSEDLLLCWQRFCTCWSLKDKFNTFILKNKLIAKSIEGIFATPKVKSRTIRDYGFSTKMINRFFKPFFSGIFLENNWLHPIGCLIL